MPCALPGAQLPGMAISQTAIRGVESSGMLCSARELGLEDAAQGLLLLPSDAPVGMDFRCYYELEDQHFYTQADTESRRLPGLVGIAREVAAITSAKLQPLTIIPVRRRSKGV